MVAARCMATRLKARTPWGRRCAMRAARTPRQGRARGRGGSDAGSTAVPAWPAFMSFLVALFAKKLFFHLKMKGFNVYESCLAKVLPLNTMISCIWSSGRQLPPGHGCGLPEIAAELWS